MKSDVISSTSPSKFLSNTKSKKREKGLDFDIIDAQMLFSMCEVKQICISINHESSFFFKKKYMLKPLLLQTQINSFFGGIC